MKIYKKVLLYFWLSLFLQLVLLIFLACFFNLDKNYNTAISETISWQSFLISLLFIFIFNPLIFLILNNDKERIKQTIFPIVLNSLITSIMFTFFSLIYFNLYNSYQSKLANFQSVTSIIILFILASLLIFIIIFYSNIFFTKFIFLTKNDDLMQEWEIINFLFLFFTKTKVYHTKNFSYLTNNKNRFLILKFIFDNDDLAKINYKHKIKERVKKEEGEEGYEIIEKEIPASKIINEMEKNVKKTSNLLDVEASGFIVFFENVLPEIIGEPNKINIIKKNEIIKYFYKNKINDYSNKDIKNYLGELE